MLQPGSASNSSHSTDTDETPARAGSVAAPPTTYSPAWVGPKKTHSLPDAAPGCRQISFLPMSKSWVTASCLRRWELRLDAAPVRLQKPLPFEEFEVRLEDVEICKRPDGSPWHLGQGSFGSGMSLPFSLLRWVAPSKQADACPHSASAWPWLPEWRQELPLICAVYKALKGVETVAVKFCQSVVSDKDKVRREPRYHPCSCAHMAIEFSLGASG